MFEYLVIDLLNLFMNYIGYFVKLFYTFTTNKSYRIPSTLDSQIYFVKKVRKKIVFNKLSRKNICNNNCKEEIILGQCYISQQKISQICHKWKVVNLRRI